MSNPLAAAIKANLNRQIQDPGSGLTGGVLLGGAYGGAYGGRMRKPRGGDLLGLLGPTLLANALPAIQRGLKAAFHPQGGRAPARRSRGGRIVPGSAAAEARALKAAATRRRNRAAMGGRMRRPRGGVIANAWASDMKKLVHKLTGGARASYRAHPLNAEARKMRAQIAAEDRASNLLTACASGGLDAWLTRSKAQKQADNYARRLNRLHAASGGVLLGGRRRPYANPNRSMAAVHSAARNPWIAHVRAYWDSHPGISYKEALMEARSSY